MYSINLDDETLNTLEAELAIEDDEFLNLLDDGVSDLDIMLSDDDDSGEED